MKVSTFLASAALVAAAQALVGFDPARISACQRPTNNGCAQLCEQCTDSADSSPSEINACFDKSNFNKLCIAAQAQKVFDPARINACQHPVNGGCAKICEKCTDSTDPSPSVVNTCLDKSNFDKLCISRPSKLTTRADIDCEKVKPYKPSEVLQGECKVLCVFAKKSGDWMEFEEHCKQS
ncbi:hypothetical protein ABW20_dc0109721 [Dactylellina cionopaga]|nr:hypothetical protein ABW20_dc0109721 [Dactylellina cionopaga]